MNTRPENDEYDYTQGGVLSDEDLQLIDEEAEESANADNNTLAIREGSDYDEKPNEKFADTARDCIQPSLQSHIQPKEPVVYSLGLLSQFYILILDLLKGYFPTFFKSEQNKNKSQDNPVKIIGSGFSLFENNRKNTGIKSELGDPKIFSTK